MYMNKFKNFNQKMDKIERIEGHGLHWLFAIRDFFEKHLSSILFLDSILDWAKLLELDTKSCKVILNATPPKEKKKGNNYKIGPTTMLK